MTSKNCINCNEAERYVQHNNQIKKEIQKVIVIDHIQPSGEGLTSVF